MKLLVIKPSSLGDVIHALPFLQALKDTYPDARVDWVISKSLKGILEDNPLIHELILFDKDRWKNLIHLPDTLKELSSLKRKLQSKQYDRVVDLQGLLRSGLISFFTRGTEKIGFADAREGSRFFYDTHVAVNENMHAVDKCLEVAREIGADVKDIHFPLHVHKKAKDSITSHLGQVKDYVVVVPSARWRTKRWPAGHFASLIRMLSVPCVITGSKDDAGIAGEIKKNVRERRQGKQSQKGERQKAQGKLIDLCGKTDLKELTALIAGAMAVVSNDSGPMHIAAALGIPTVAIFGPTDPVKTGPYGWQKNKKLNVVRADISCSPCRRKACGDWSCMSTLSPETVFEALKSICDKA